MLGLKKTELLVIVCAILINLNITIFLHYFIDGPIYLIGSFVIGYALGYLAVPLHDYLFGCDQ